ncbi:MAG: hypothetical protein BroJett030_06950 [Alphaproteobacteria bacterium]|nr:MAG: hypothetical protein BroJett030_06950 [Alphaproteobacteria bacterium]
MRAIALDVAAPEVAPETSDTPNDRLLAGAADETEITEISALAPREDERPAQRQLSLMSPAASAARLELAAPPPVQAALAAPDDDRAAAFDPAEAAAQARIPALYASIDHGQCEGGWGPKPTMINAKRIIPGHPYYMEMRLRHTPPLPVGHVYIAYGRIGPDGNPLDEKLVMLAPVGGYGGAAVAAAVPMPGVQKPYGDDCVLRPIAAYRVSLSASQFEQLLIEIERQREKKPTYALFAYNCNHFMSDVAKSVGILPPQNIYTPSLQYFYEMMDRNEGRRVARTADELKLAAAN